MKKSKITGFKEVFWFSFVQTLKSKTFIVTTILTAIVMLVVLPLSSQSSAMGIEESKIERIVVKDDTEFSENKYSELNEMNNERYAKAIIEKSSKELEDLQNLLEESEDYNNAVIVHIGKSDTSYDIEIYKNSESSISETDILLFSEDLYETFNMIKAKNVGISEEQLEFLDMPIETEVSIKDVSESVVEDSDNKSSRAKTLDSTGAFFISMIMFMLLVMSGENIATSIVTEKSSKVIEYMLTSIKPLALIVGKALAAIATSLIQVAVIVICTVISFDISLSSGTAKETELQLESLGINQILDNFSVGGVLLAVIITILGFCIFTLFACLVSSTASRIEEIGETNMIYSVLLIAGLYLNMPLMMPGFGCSELYKNIMLLTPVTSPFITPIYLIFGELNIWMALGCIAIQIITLWMLVVFVSNVYETLIMYNGNRVKFKQLFSIFRSNIKGGVSHE